MVFIRADPTLNQVVCRKKYDFFMQYIQNKATYFPLLKKLLNMLG